MSRLYVGNLSFKTTARDLGQLFETVGPVSNVDIKSRYERSLGFGFVDMSTEADAQRAAKELNERELDGRKLRIEIARPFVPRQQSERAPSRRPFRGRRAPRRTPRRPRRVVDENAPISQTRVFLGNLPFQTTEDEVKAAFGGCNVKEVILIKGFSGRSRGYGFVEFQTHADQEKGIQIGSNLTLSDRKLTCAAARELTKE
ncbi:putative Single-stranded TG1-3 DNA-binding protein [Blattamonas nauphoetae]|uniref:Single-stranded TG1-3 DNA-binding protein n=1 Tax=Blattamonas nauphoetae TaxID=2049346 RepID=A0ABQ9XQQ9_9EUKA|nr:putative Single-stranded TG1-3 DNA-binding protein [Blattamonas nauphoetae]